MPDVVKDAVNVKDPQYHEKLQARVKQMMDEQEGSDPSAGQVSNVTDDFKWPGTDPLPDLNDLVADKPTKKEAKAADNKRKVKFSDAFGEEVEEEIDLEKLPELAADRRKAKLLEEEMKALRDEVDSRRKAAQKEIEKAQKWLKLQEQGDDALLEEVLKARGGVEGFKKSLIEEYEQVSKMTDAEKEAFNYKQAQAAAARRISELEKQVQKQLQQLNEREKTVDNNSRIAIMRGVYNGYAFPNPSSDEAISSINETIFNKAQKAIKALEDEKVTITESILHREFKRAADTFKGKIVTAKVDPKKQMADAMDSTVADAQKVMSESSSKGQEPTDTDILKRWAGLAQEGKLKQVSAEGLSSPKYASLYEKFVEMLQSNPKFLQRRKK
jgi:hypothetical protein